MGYLTRENNYGRGRKMEVKRVSKTDVTTMEPWWADCPVCPISKGFAKFVTHGRALTWALDHIEDHRRTLLLIEMRATRA